MYLFHSTYNLELVIPTLLFPNELRAPSQSQERKSHTAYRRQRAEKSDSGAKSHLGTIAGITGGVGALALLVGIFFIVRWRRRNRRKEPLEGTAVPRPLSPPPPLPAVEFKSRMPSAGTLAAKMQALVRQRSPSPESHDRSTAETQESQEQHSVPGETNIDRIEAQLSAMLHRLAVLETAERDQAPPDYVSSYEPS
ncbi:hypothetical protein V5O48_005566 [Marasmius crinis-equi]|uniref:Uncharacterized protein n=1 Tax=Marasmius crinis-equi TaxID=585013 RepID=A0ABR3FMA8_9AGAR